MAEVRFLYKGIRNNKPVCGTLFAVDFQAVIAQLKTLKIMPTELVCHKSDVSRLVASQDPSFFNHDESYREAEKELIASGKLIEINVDGDEP